MIGNISNLPVSRSYQGLVQYSSSGQLFTATGTQINNINVTVTNALTASFALSASSAISSSYAGFARTASLATSASFATTSISSSVSINSLSSSFSQFSVSSSFASTSSFTPFAISSSFATTASFARLAATASVLVSGTASFLQGTSGGGIFGTTLGRFAVNNTDTTFQRTSSNTLRINDFLNVSRLQFSTVDNSSIASSANMIVRVDGVGSGNQFSIFGPASTTVPIFRISTNPQVGFSEQGRAGFFDFNNFFLLGNNSPLSFGGSPITLSTAHPNITAKGVISSGSIIPLFRYTVSASSDQPTIQRIAAQIAAFTPAGESGDGLNSLMFQTNTFALNNANNTGSFFLSPSLVLRNSFTGSAGYTASTTTSHSAIIGSVIFNSSPEVHFGAASGLGIGISQEGSNGNPQPRFHVNANTGSMVDMRIIANSIHFHAISGSVFIQSGSLVLSNTGSGISIREGSNATMGTVTLTGGSGSVSTTRVTANSRVFLSHQTSTSPRGALSISSRSAGSNFVVSSSLSTDLNTVAWMIIEPN